MSIGVCGCGLTAGHRPGCPLYQGDVWITPAFKPESADLAAALARAEAAEARVAALEAAIEACDAAMTGLTLADDPDFTRLYQVAAGHWHAVLAVARGAMPIVKEGRA